MLDFFGDLLDKLQIAATGCQHHPATLPDITSREVAAQVWEWVQKCPEEARRRHIREVAEKSLFWFTAYVLGKSFVNCDWGFDRCQEVQKNPNGYLDLWAREHLKSTIITRAMTIWDILKNPELTFCILSYNHRTATAFLREIMTEFEFNELMKECWPDVCYKDPRNESTKWAETKGICVRRKSLRMEQTIEAYGLVDGQPTGRHFDILVFDDVVTDEFVSNADMIELVTSRFQQAHNIGSRGGVCRYIGTLYHEADTWNWAIRQGVVKVRRYPVFWESGPNRGEPCFFDWETTKKRELANGPRNWALQFLLDPKADTSKDHWRIEWIERYSHPVENGANVYLLVDPADAQTKTSDYTVMIAVALCADRNYRVLDMVRDRLTLKQRAERLIAMHAKFTGKGLGMKPKNVGYEKYSMNADISYIREKMDELNYHFHIEPLAGNKVKKEDRILRLRPIFEERRLFFPTAIQYVDSEGKEHELVSEFIEQEYSFPVGRGGHDDMRDCLSRILDERLGATFPVGTITQRMRDYQPDDDYRRPPSFLAS